MTDFPQEPPRYQPILDSYLAFVRSRNRQPEGAPPWHPRTHLGPSMRASWKNGTRQLYEELRAQKVPEKEHADFVQWACKRLEKNALTNKSPGSLVYLVGKWRHNKNVMALFGEDVEYEEDAMVICEKCERLVYAEHVENGLCMDCRTLLGWEEDYMQVNV